MPEDIQKLPEAEALIKYIRDTETKRQEEAKNSAQDNSSMFDKARAEVSNEILKYVDELESNLLAAKINQDKKAQSQILNSLRILNFTIDAYNLLNGSLGIVDSAHKLFLGNTTMVDQKHLVNLGKNVIKTAENFNKLLDASSVSLGEKVLLTMKAFAFAVISGISGFLKGLVEGFKKEDGLLNKLSSMAQNSVVQGLSSFHDKFADELGKAAENTTNSSTNSEKDIEMLPIDSRNYQQ
ncbi:Uncharacterised protein [Legionella busanensis]|uniref:Uncharacterized protein n=1 Tax=Legionella busanensis TaxID=190655 RepID=A0A378JK89_9GAMM|nr:hypothetical protein [Legionella busanensis]STX51584.1 Uncharacterised protein [Legionella busanensis]